MTPNILLRFTITEPGSSGVPSSQYVPDLHGRIDDYSQTISATYGFESMQCSFKASVEEALDWLQNGLMRSVVVTEPEGTTIWEGFLETVEVQFGQERRSVSITPIANRIKTRYTDVLGQSRATSTLNDTTSQSRYGIKMVVISIGVADSTSATNEATVRLAELKNPRMLPQTTCATGDQGEVRVTLHWMGWYGTFEWETTSVTTTATATTVPTQIATLHGTLANTFIPSVISEVTGTSMTQYIAPDTTFKTAFEDRLKKGDGTNRFAWGVFEARVFQIYAWAGATPTTVHYRRLLGGSDVYDATSGSAIAPWNLRPNRMYEVIDLLDVAPTTAASDTATRYCVERVICSIRGDQVDVQLEPAAFDSVDVRLAKIEAIWGGVT